MPFEDLHYWPLEPGYALSLSDNRRSTIISKEEDNLYRVKCANCDEQAVRLISRSGELQAIACSKCGEKVVRLGTMSSRREQPGKARLGRTFS